MRSVEARKVRKQSPRQKGFTLTELAIATAVLLFGVVAVMQLVPFAMKTNTSNRYDTTSAVIAQRLLDEMTAQPLTNATMTDPVCGAMSLGAGAVGVTAASPNATYLTPGTATVDFTQAAVAGYNCNYVDPNSAAGPTYQVRWAVVVSVGATGQIEWKRYVVGVRTNMPQFRLPVNIGATVQR